MSSLGVLFVVLWSSAWIAGKIALPYAGPFTLLLISFASAGVVLLLVALGGCVLCRSMAGSVRRAGDS